MRTIYFPFEVCAYVNMWFAMDALTNVTKLKAQNDMNVSLFWLLVPSRFY